MFNGLPLKYCDSLAGLFIASCDNAANIFTCKTLSDPTWIKSGVPFETLQ